MSLPYAEQILSDAQKNQYFVQYFIRDLNFDSDNLMRQMEWFQTRNLIVQEVQTVHFREAHTGFLHVRFSGADDPRLAEYSQTFEDDQGMSLLPGQYQMYEWSYSAWMQEGGRDAYQEHMDSLNVTRFPTQQGDIVGPT